LQGNATLERQDTELATASMARALDAEIVAQQRRIAKLEDARGSQSRPPSPCLIVSPWTGYRRSGGIGASHHWSNPQLRSAFALTPSSRC